MTRTLYVHWKPDAVVHEEYTTRRYILTINGVTSTSRQGEINNIYCGRVDPDYEINMRQVLYIAHRPEEK